MRFRTKPCVILALSWPLDSLALIALKPRAKVSLNLFSTTLRTVFQGSRLLELEDEKRSEERRALGSDDRHKSSPMLELHVRTFLLKKVHILIYPHYTLFFSPNCISYGNLYTGIIFTYLTVQGRYQSRRLVYRSLNPTRLNKLGSN